MSSGFQTPRLVRFGSHGAEVEALQNALNLHGFGPIGVDGNFGAKTERALRRYQLSNDLEADGICGPATWSKLADSPTSGLDSSRNPPKFTMYRQVSDMIDALDRGPIKSVLLAALSFVGKKEIPDGSNDGPEIAPLVRGYREFHRWDTPNAPGWCMIAVSSCIAFGLGLCKNYAYETDWSKHPLGTWQGGTINPGGIYTWGLKNGRLHHTPKPGDIFVKKSGDVGHAGLVVGIDPMTGILYTLEGNVSNQFGIRVQDPNKLLGFVRWA